jgi:hypothetical protein
MTKYVLNSGGIRNQPELARAFFAEVFKGLGSNPRLLICFFALPREDWETKFVQDKENLPRLFPNGVHPILDIAFPETFAKQLRKNDAVYMHGGDDHLIQYWLRQFDIPHIWEGKVVATNSASSNALSTSFWTCDWRQCMEGLGILPIKFLGHFESSYGQDDSRGPVDWQKGKKELEEYGDITLPVYPLKEGEFVVIEI